MTTFHDFIYDVFFDLGAILKKHISKESNSKYLYFVRTRKFLNLKTPRTWNEKLQWLMLYWRNPLMTKCADKVMVRNYLIEKHCDDILNEVFNIWDIPDDISISSLPQMFALKCNFGCGYNILCRDKTIFDVDKAKDQLRKWYKVNLDKNGVEWQYKNIPKKIYAEKFLESKTGHFIECQLFCFNGEPAFFLVRNDLGANSNMDGTYAVSYSIDWTRLYLRKGEEKYQIEVPKPVNYQKMIDYARKLSADFPHVRVDFYEVDDKLYFGELTFSSSGAVMSNYKKEAQLKYGELLVLPEKYNSNGHD